MRRLKQAVVLPIFASAILAGSTGVFAEQKDLTVTLGLKLWANTWGTFGFNDDPTTGRNVLSGTSGLEIAPLPTLTLKFKDFFLNAGTFIKTSYDFPNFSDVVNFLGVPVTVTQATSDKRSENDINIGWYFHPQVAATIGYKAVKQEVTATLSAPALPPATFTQTNRYKALTLGLQGNAQIGDSRFFLYGSGAYGPKIKVSGISGVSGWYATSDVGVAYAVSNSVSLTAGYKTQIIHLEVAGLEGRDVTSGLIVGANWTF